MTSIAEIRKEYQMQTLLEGDIAQNPIDQFGKWWDDAIRSEIEEVNAMTLATASPAGVPSARIVLLKEYNEEGFVFFTNYESRKGTELAQNPQACLVFFWKELERQVRVNGSVEKISDAASDDYFLSRPSVSRLGAWSSPQSKVIQSREFIEERMQHFREQFQNTIITRPPNWGGYIVKPVSMEFWQGRPGRLHDRFLYTFTGSEGWTHCRLAP